MEHDSGSRMNEKLVKIGLSIDYPIEWDMEMILRDLIENSFEHISFKDDMDRFLKKYPRRSDSQLARKICAESEYRYVINKWIKFRQFKEEEPDFYGVDE